MAVTPDRLCGDLGRRLGGAKAEGAQIVEGLLGLGGGREDRGVIGAQDEQPLGDVARVTVVERGRQAKLGADRRARAFGDEFFDAVSCVPESLAERTVKPGPAARPMPLMPISA